MLHPVTGSASQTITISDASQHHSTLILSLNGGNASALTTKQKILQAIQDLRCASLLNTVEKQEMFDAIEKMLQDLPEIFSGVEEAERASLILGALWYNLIQPTEDENMVTLIRSLLSLTLPEHESPDTFLVSYSQGVRHQASVERMTKIREQMFQRLQQAEEAIETRFEERRADIQKACAAESIDFKNSRAKVRSITTATSAQAQRFHDLIAKAAKSCQP